MVLLIFLFAVLASAQTANLEKANALPENQLIQKIKQKFPNITDQKARILANAAKNGGIEKLNLTTKKIAKIKQTRTQLAKMKALKQKLGDKKFKQLLKRKMLQIEKRRELIEINGTKRTLYSLTIDKGKNPEIIESIPKDVAQNLSDVEFSEQPTEILQNDPIVKWSFQNVDAPKEITYSVKGEKTNDTETVATEDGNIFTEIAGWFVGLFG